MNRVSNKNKIRTWSFYCLEVVDGVYIYIYNYIYIYMLFVGKTALDRLAVRLNASRISLCYLLPVVHGMTMASVYIRYLPSPFCKANAR